MHQSLRDTQAFDEAILRTLRDDPLPWQATIAAAAFVRRCAYHGVEALLAKRRPEWPASVMAALDELLLRRTMWEMRHLHLMQALLRAFEARGIAPPIIIKGTALAYTIYESPQDRPRSDTDLLLAPDSQDAAHAVFTECGFVREDFPYSVATRQASYVYATTDGQRHVVDAHRQINNSAVLSRLFSHGELRQRAQTVPALSPLALAPATIDSVLIACFHRQTHRTNPYFHDGVAYADPSRLIWLMDIHLLVRNMDARAWSELHELAISKGIAAVCGEGLYAAERHFGTALPRGVVGRLESAAKSTRDEYLHSSKLRQQWMDILALESPERWRYVREVVFPPRAIMVSKYPGWPAAALPLLYIARAAAGVAREFAQSRRA